MLRHLVLMAFLALWVSFVIAEASVATKFANPQNTAPISDAVKENSDDLKADASAWGGYGGGWGGRGHYGGGGWGGRGYYGGGGWGGRGHYGGGGWGGRGHYGGGWGGRGYHGGGWGGYGGGFWG